MNSIKRLYHSTPLVSLDFSLFFYNQAYQADERQHQILKVFVTLYDADNRNNEELVAITRHEFGHAFGLLHSTAPEDLMHENFRTEFPYISQCDLDAIISLYDNQNPNQVICRG